MLTLNLPTILVHLFLLHAVKLTDNMDRQRFIKDFFSSNAQQTKRKPIEPLETKPSEFESDELQPSKKRCIDELSENDLSEDQLSADIPITNSNTRLKLSSIELNELCQVPNQFHPLKSFSFPKQIAGRNRNRSAQHRWFTDFKWLHYDVQKDIVLCYTCLKACAIAGDKSDWLKEAELAFISKGFSNWKDGTVRLEKHAKSSFHLKCHNLIVQRETATPINAQLQNLVLNQQTVARTCLLRIISSLRYLCLSGNAIRGSDNEGGNLIELLKERVIDFPELKNWLAKSDNYTSPQIQNELIEIMAHEVQKVLVQKIKSSPWYSVIADGTTDVSSDEQISICARYTEPNSLQPEELFLGMYNADDGCAKTITAAIKDVLLRLGLSLDDLRGHCFDGAPTMSGRHNGVQKLLQMEQPKSIYVHCANHSLDLVLQETAKLQSGVCDVMCLVKDVSNTIRESSKRKKVYNGVNLACEDDDLTSDDDLPVDKAPTQLLGLCPTRWCIRVQSLKRFKENYLRVQETLVKLLNCASVKPEKKAQIRGWLLKLEQSETLFYLNVSIQIFAPCEQLARVLQAPGLTATGAKQSADVLSSRLKSLRTDTEFDHLFEKTLEESNEFDLNPLQKPRVRKPKKRYEHTSNSVPPVQLSAKDLLRKNYFEILDLQITQIKERFDQSGLSTLVSLETVLLNATRGLVGDEAKLAEELGVFAEDFNISRLHAELFLLQSVPGIMSCNCSELCDKLSKLPSTTKDMLDQVILLVILITTVAASAATSERSFSALKRLKTYLRNSMSQKRLTHLLLLHVHKEITAGLDLNVIMKEFVARSEKRKTVFGKVV